MNRNETDRSEYLWERSKRESQKQQPQPCFAGAVLFATGTTCQAAGETYDTAMEAAYGDTFRSVYENRLAGSPLEAEAADGVDTATGHLMLSRTDLSLEGTGGMDLNGTAIMTAMKQILDMPRWNI